MFSIASKDLEKPLYRLFQEGTGTLSAWLAIYVADICTIRFGSLCGN